MIIKAGFDILSGFYLTANVHQHAHEVGQRKANLFFKADLKKFAHSKWQNVPKSSYQQKAFFTMIISKTTWMDGFNEDLNSRINKN